MNLNFAIQLSKSNIVNTFILSDEEIPKIENNIVFAILKKALNFEDCV